MIPLALPLIRQLYNSWVSFTSAIQAKAGQLSTGVDTGLLYGPWVAERTAEFDRFLAAHSSELDPVVREILEQGRRFTAIDVFTAQHRRQELAHAVHCN